MPAHELSFCPRQSTAARSRHAEPNAQVRLALADGCVLLWTRACLMNLTTVLVSQGGGFQLPSVGKTHVLRSSCQHTIPAQATLRHWILRALHRSQTL